MARRRFAELGIRLRMNAARCACLLPSASMEPTAYTDHNRAHWDKHAGARVSHGAERWRRTEPVWGQWARPDSELGLLPETMESLDAIELGCGTAYISGWMARRGATVVGIDNSARQIS